MLIQLYSHGMGHTHFKNTNIGTVPKEWEVVKLDSITVSGTQNGLYKPESEYGSGIEMVHMGELFAKDNIQSGGMRRVQISDSELMSHGLNEGDLLFARRSIVFEGAGKSSVVGKLLEPLVFESSMIRVQLQLHKANPIFFLYWFQSPAGRKVMSSITRRGSIAGIAASDLSKIEVPLPPLDEQHRIAGLFNIVRNDREKWLLQRARTHDLRSALTNNLLS
jgi:type I restriction enzyme S subunit